MSMCGPSAAETIAQGEQSSLAMSMQSAFQQRFKDQSTLLNNLNASITPIVAAGPSQEGFSPEELAARNTTAINSAAAANRNAAQVAGNVMAGQGAGGPGGTSSTGLESGIQRAIKAGISTGTANELASAQNQIVAENYATGRSNYEKAVAGAQALSGEYAPQTFGSQAESGLQTSFGEADKINQEQQALGKDIFGGALSLAQSIPKIISSIKGG